MSRRNTIFKLFHLVNDHFRDGSEKVFLVDDELKKIKRELSGKVNPIGLIGPIHKIRSYLKKEVP